MSSKFYDFIVIGGGSGGVRAARWAAALGAKVAICEKDRFGGTCVIRGCIPKKLMVYASEYAHEREIMESFGWQHNEQTEPSLNWQRFKEKRDAEVQRLSDLYEKNLLNHNVDLFKGHARFKSEHEVLVGDEILKGDHILIAVGGRPETYEVPGAEYLKNSDQIFHLESIPKNLLVVGGGYIALEFASIFHGLGSQVKVVIRKDKILRGFDDSIRAFLQEQLQKAGVGIITDQLINRIERKDETLVAHLTDGRELEADEGLYALGRRPVTDSLDLEKMGVSCGASGEVLVNEKYQTNVSHVYAVGDCIDRVNLTPVALEQGMVVAESLFSSSREDVSYHAIPSAVFTQPPLASVGLGEEEAREVYGDGIDVYESSFRPLKISLSDLPDRSFVKCIVESSSQKVIGAHMVGWDSPEIMQGIAIAVRAGLKKSDFDRTVGLHPSSAEEFTTLRDKR